MQRTTSFVIAVTIAALAVVGVGSVIVMGSKTKPAPSQTRTVEKPYKNARCFIPGCGREFNIPEEHRGTIAEDIREYRCPNCGEWCSPGMLYIDRNGNRNGMHRR